MQLISKHPYEVEMLDQFSKKSATQKSLKIKDFDLRR
jgi:hypothetical protein